MRWSALPAPSWNMPAGGNKNMLSLSENLCYNEWAVTCGPFLLLQISYYGHWFGNPSPEVLWPKHGENA